MDVRDVLIYRSALNADEAATLWKGGLLQASLEVYSPLADRQFVGGPSRIARRACRNSSKPARLPSVR
jgi:hypothetical protein